MKNDNGDDNNGNDWSNGENVSLKTVHFGLIFIGFPADVERGFRVT